MGKVSYKLMDMILLKKIQEESVRIMEKYKESALKLDPNDSMFYENFFKLQDEAIEEIKNYSQNLCLVEYKEIFAKICEEKDSLNKKENK
jgi:hypothetical protein